MTKTEMAELMDAVFNKCHSFRESGQAEYAHKNENAFANFERVAERLDMDRKKVLLVYLEKHLDGIHSHVNGHKSQREDVRGRLIDLIVYSFLLYGMIESEETIKTIFLDKNNDSSSTASE